MEIKLGNFIAVCDEGIAVTLEGTENKGGVETYTFKVDWTKENGEKDSKVDIRWRTPMLDFMYRWNPSCRFNRNIGPEWAGYTSSMISAQSPVECMYDGKGNNKYTWALDECANLVYYRSGAVEENGELGCRFFFNLRQFTEKTSTTFRLRIDTRYIPLYEAVADVAEWWAKDCGMTPAFVPSDAKEPVYSFWYSFHQEVVAKDVEDECRRAKKMGFNVCIIDDGWQTGDNNRGYAYCGDWKVAPEKIPDMKKHVENVHKIGMKYVIWYSVPFMGFKSENHERFKDMVLRNDEGLETAVLDPRYKEVREFLVNIYKTALTEWNLDGFKLDFIDQWRPDWRNAPYNEKMDIASLPEAVDELLTLIMTTLKAIKPDILLEFRQGYIGPNMRKYGNMFRVADCPNDYISNRVGIFDLRMFMGKTAVHSDMLMWHKDEKAETAALQIISVLFGVLQYSAKLDRLPERTRKMSEFWLTFMNDHRELLLEAPVKSYEPHLLYTWAKSAFKDECAVAVYGVDKCVAPDAVGTIYIANGCMNDRVLVDLCGKYKVKVVDCCGETAYEKSQGFDGITTLDVPVGGLVTLKRA